MRYAIRRLRRAPSFATVVILTLAVGVAFSTAVFGIVRAIRTNVVPPVDLSNLYVVRVTNTMNGWDQLGLPLAEFRRIQPQLAEAGIVPAVSDVREPMAIAADGRAETVHVEGVSGEYARVFDVRPAAGRWLTNDDDAGNGRPVAIISARLWRDWFGRADQVVDRTSILINGARFEIVGVAAEDFRGVQPALSPPEMWIPENTLPLLYPPKQDPRWFAGHSVTTILKGSTNVAELQTRLASALAGGSLARDPDHLKARIERASALNAEVDSRGQIVLALALLVLMASCANVSNLLYARGTEIRGELAVRVALGANRAQLVRIIVSEASVIGACASALGWLGAFAMTSAFQRAFPTFVVDRMHYAVLTIAPDWRMFAWSVVSGMTGAVAIGVGTGVAASREMPAGWMAGRAAATADIGRTRLRTTLVAIQVTAALLLIMVTGLLLENAPSSLSARVRYDSERLTVAGVDLTPYSYQQPAADAFFAHLLTASRGAPGVQRAALASAIPGGAGEDAPTIVPLIAATRNNVNGATRRITAASIAVSPTFFDTLGIAVDHGRVFTQVDTDGAPLTAVLSRSAATVLFPGRDPVGLPITYGFGGSSLTVVGVVEDPVTGPSEQAPFAQPSNVVFIPLAQHPQLNARLIVSGPEGVSVAEPLRNAVRLLDDRVGLFGPTRLNESLLAWAAPLKAARVLLLAGAATALAIALLGIYGMLTYFVTLRAKEFGIRMALGASRRGIMRLVLDYAVHVLLIGLLSGVLLATLSSRVFEHLLVQLMPNEIQTWAVVPILVLMTGVLAACLPALRASRVDPNVALRDL